MKNPSDYDAYMKFTAVALIMAIFSFVIPAVHNFMDNLFIYDVGVNGFNKSLESLVIIISSGITVPIYNIFYQELVK